MNSKEEQAGRTLIVVGLGITAAAFAGQPPHLWDQPGEPLLTASKASKYPSSSMETRIVHSTPGRQAFLLWKPLQQMILETVRMIPSPSLSAYYKGGFEAKMSKREACLILAVSPSANRTKIAEAHKRIMLLNHPDKGGSPFLAAKINEAKDLMNSSNKK
ncbi:dnaJ homolog subfamily C member 15-like isoform X1 [Narcine bancroftii]|uniref:dnaJ homolog subfamily C member 15-like isoform X1 n=1 Tax=Narcine bancroftii TaxID=1343680 RepID=UPI0038315D4E